MINTLFQFMFSLQIKFELTALNLRFAELFHPSHHRCAFCSLLLRSRSTISILKSFIYTYCFQNQPSKSVFRKRCSENMLQIYRKTPMPNCDFNKVGLQQIPLRHGCSPIGLMHTFRASFYRTPMEGCSVFHQHRNIL